MISYLLQFMAWTVFMAVLVLLPAGTLDYPGGWAFIVLFAVGGLAMVLWLGKYSPSLLRERMSAPWQREQKGWDKVWLTAFMLAFLAWLVFMAWDAGRTRFVAMPAWLQVVGFLIALAYMAGVWWTFRENAFAAPVVKIQEGQKVIDTGPYAYVRHPMYTSALLFFVSLPLILGSWWGLLLAVPFILGVAWRAVHEEEALRAGLSGYDAYAARVRYRFVPMVW